MCVVVVVVVVGVIVVVIVVVVEVVAVIVLTFYTLLKWVFQCLHEDVLVCICHCQIRINFIKPTSTTPNLNLRWEILPQN